MGICTVILIYIYINICTIILINIYIALFFKITQSAGAWEHSIMLSVVVGLTLDIQITVVSSELKLSICIVNKIYYILEIGVFSIYIAIVPLYVTVTEFRSERFRIFRKS